MNDRTSGTGPADAAQESGLPAARSGSLRAQSRRLLDLARRDRPSAEGQFARLHLAEQRDMVLAAPINSRIDMILLSEDCTDLVQALPEADFYRTVRAAGMWESREIVEAASQDQVAFLLDHECWRGEKFRPRKFLNWLRLFLDSDDHEAERILQLLSADLLVFALKRYVRFVGDIVVAGRYHCTPDQVRTSNPTVQEFLLRLYDIDADYFVRLMAWVSTLEGSTAQADAIAAREGRLVEQGFPHLSQSQVVYEPVELDVAQRPAFRPEDVETTHALLVSERGRALFFIRTLERGIREGRFSNAFSARFQHEIVLLANKVMVADQVDLSDEQAQRRVLDRVRRWVNVGIEGLSGCDEQRGIEVIAKHELEFAFRVAHTLMTEIATQVAETETVLPERLLRPLLGERYLDAWDSLRRDEPALPGWAGSDGTAYRLIGTLAEMHAALALAREIHTVAVFHSGKLPIDVQRVVRDGDLAGRPAPSADEVSGMILVHVLAADGRPSAFPILPLRTWSARLRQEVGAVGGADLARRLADQWLRSNLGQDDPDPFDVEVLRALWSDLIRSATRTGG
jgi:hypothetical protein